MNEMYLKYFKLFGIEKYVMRFSTHDPAKLGQKFVDEPELWKQDRRHDARRPQRIPASTTSKCRTKPPFTDRRSTCRSGARSAASSRIATNQVDFAEPRSFDLRYKDRDNTDKTPLCIHRAPLGTHERFIGFLIEHYAGNFPLWLAPEQVRILTDRR